MNRKKLGEILKSARLVKGLKQTEIFPILGIKNTTLCNYETGESSPNIDTLIKLCNLYGLDCGEVLAEAYGIGNIEQTESEAELLKAYRSMNTYDRKSLDVISKLIAERPA